MDGHSSRQTIFARRREAAMPLREIGLIKSARDCIEVIDHAIAHCNAAGISQRRKCYR
jgi:hypothetical protein